MMTTANEALLRLRAGNERFASGKGGLSALLNHIHRDSSVDGQQPFAVILGCSDSRVPVEGVFDQALGDLFVIRVAGNIVAPSQIGSVEFAADRYDTRLVVVLGHTNCGAVRATVSELQRPGGEVSPNLRSIVDRISPAVAEVINQNPEDDIEQLLKKAVRANIMRSADDLRHGSEIIENLAQNHGLRIVGAEYSLETGLVEFFDID
jgi:carbonic anhydrase